MNQQPLTERLLDFLVKPIAYALIAICALVPILIIQGVLLALHTLRYISPLLANLSTFIFSTYMVAGGAVTLLLLLFSKSYCRWMVEAPFPFQFFFIFLWPIILHRWFRLIRHLPRWAHP